MTRYYEAPSELEIEEAIVKTVGGFLINKSMRAILITALHDLIKKQKCLEEMDKTIIGQMIGAYILKQQSARRAGKNIQYSIELADLIHATFGKPVGMIVPEKKNELESKNTWEFMEVPLPKKLSISRAPADCDKDVYCKINDLIDYLSGEKEVVESMIVPEKLEDYQSHSPFGTTLNYNKGWNACIDDFHKLNKTND